MALKDKILNTTPGHDSIEGAVGSEVFSASATTILSLTGGKYAVCRGFLITADGNIAFTLVGDTDSQTFPVKAGSIYPFVCSDIGAGSTATGRVYF